MCEWVCSTPLPECVFQPPARRGLQGQGRIWSNDITCDGTELGVQHCRHRAWGGLKLDPAGFGPACDHSGDIGVECGPQPREPACCMLFWLLAQAQVAACVCVCEIAHR